MFYVFSTNGKLFDGPLEKLRSVEQADQTAAQKEMDFAHSLVDAAIGEGNGGAVSHGAIARYKASLPQKNQREVIYHVYQIMSKPVQVLELTSPIKAVYEAFQRFPFRAFPIVTSHHQICSLVRRDTFFNLLVERPINAMGQIELQRVPELLEPEVISTAPVTDVRRAAQIFVERHSLSIPVVDDHGKVLGIIGKSDILSCLAKDPPLSIWC